MAAAAASRGGVRAPTSPVVLPIEKDSVTTEINQRGLFIITVGKSVSENIATDALIS